MLKASLHIHVQGDLDDYIPYTIMDLVERAYELHFDVLAITTHRRILCPRVIQDAAKELGILLIPGIELNLNGHILILNATQDAETLKTLPDLREYKKNHPECFVIAAHPFFIGKSKCLQKRLAPNLDLFDGLEKSWFYTPKIDFNKKTEHLASGHDLPFIATADVHLLEQLEMDHVMIHAEKNIESIFEALRSQQFANVSEPKKLFRMLWTFAKINVVTAKKYLPRAFFAKNAPYEFFSRDPQNIKQKVSIKDPQFKI